MRFVGNRSLAPRPPILAVVSKEDPKHGRWILPVVVAALIGFTYLFVNALPPAEIPVGTTTTVVAGETLELSFGLTMQAIDLDEIVATGYGSSSRRREPSLEP